MFTCLPLHFILGTWNKIEMNILGTSMGKYYVVLLVRNWNPTRLLDKMQLLFSQQHMINSALETKAKDFRKLWDQEENWNTGGWLEIPHKWSGVFFKIASLWQATCSAFSKQFLLNALRVKTCCKFEEERISEMEYSNSLGSLNQRVVQENILMLGIRIACYNR